MEELFYSTEPDGSILIDGTLLFERMAKELNLDIEVIKMVIDKHDELLEEAGIIVFDEAYDEETE